ncbi:MAG: hypothetical protein ACI4UE_04065 [Candidatus Scatovivens sp.]
MTKNDIEKLKDFYDSRQIINENDSSIMIQNNYFNYFDDYSQVILNNVTPLTVGKLKKVLGISSNTNETKTEENQEQEPIDDDSILSNPFFTTLKLVD